MLSFDIADCDKDKAFRFLDALKLILPATSPGDIYSLILNPARTTHHWLSEEELATIGIGSGTFRMSVGISSLLQVHWAQQLIGPDKVVGILVARESELTQAHLEKVDSE